MSILRILVNDQEILRAGGEDFCSLSWDIVGSLHEESHALLDVSGFNQRIDGVYDAAYWLESYPLKQTDCVFIECIPGNATNSPFRRQSHEEYEELRQEMLRAESAGEYDAIRAVPKTRLRDRVELRIKTPNGVEAAASSPSVAAVICSGTWSVHHRPDEWLVRISEWGSKRGRSSQWLPIKGGVVVEVVA